LQSPLSPLKFNTASGHIWLDEERMLLLHARALGALRKELFDSLGVERTRGLLVRMGYASGMRDGAYAVKRRRAGMQTNEAFLLGPKLHAVEGVVQVEPIELSIDLARNHFYGEFLWRNSWECEADVQEYGHGEDPACWTQIGYASGYSSAFMGTPIVYKEIECRAQGDTHCRIVGQPADAWQDEAYLNYFAPHPFAGQLIEYSIGLEHLRSSSTANPPTNPWPAPRPLSRLRSNCCAAPPAAPSPSCCKARPASARKCSPAGCMTTANGPKGRSSPSTAAPFPPT